MYGSRKQSRSRQRSLRPRQLNDAAFLRRSFRHAKNYLGALSNRVKIEVCQYLAILKYGDKTILVVEFGPFNVSPSYGIGLDLVLQQEAPMLRVLIGVINRVLVNRLPLPVDLGS
jgi:hypothetical protein